MTDPIDRLTAALADRYRIERELGAGGMATVYLAADLKHDRKVAIKVLKPELAAVIGGERFLAEIRTTAKLQHPHILPLFDSGEADGFLFYVMPFIEGETLREKMDRERQLSIEESVQIARDVAEALDYAHRHDVIHRDIKPANILLHDGNPLVADFGIALAVSAAGGGRMTETGLSLGTPHYMSPEQASADRDLTNRSDVYSLGCVLYEMLVGAPPHTGPSAQSILVRILTEHPKRVSEERHSVPPHVEAVVAKAIEKLPADRFSTAEEFGRALDDRTFSYTAPMRAGTGGLATPPPRLPATSKARIVGLGAAFVAVAAVGLAAGLGLGGSDTTNAPFTHQPLDLENRVWIYGAPGIAPDGSAFTYPSEGGGQLLIKERGERDPRRLVDLGADGGSVSESRFSPDGRSVALERFDDDARSLWRVPRTGGAPTFLADSVFRHTWLDDARIAFLHVTRGLMVIPAGGGAATEIEVQDSTVDLSAGGPESLHDGDGLLVLGCPRARGCPHGNRDLYGLRLSTGELTFLVSDVVKAVYADAGYLLYLAGSGALFVLPFDPQRMEIEGEPVQLLQNIAFQTGHPGAFSVSRSGNTALYRFGRNAGDRSVRATLEWVDRSEAVDSIPGRPLDLDDAFSIALSPEDSWIAYRGPGSGVWVRELPDGPDLRVLEAASREVEWFGNGEELLVATAADGLWRVRADGSRPPARVLEDGTPVSGLEPTDDPDVWLVGVGVRGARDIHRLDLNSGTFTPVLETEANEGSPALSADGRWLAYMSERSGESQVYVRPYPNVDGALLQVSLDGGTSPEWSSNGRELTYFSFANRGFRHASLETEPRLAVTSRITTPAWFTGELASDHTRFLRPVRITSEDEEAPPQQGKLYLIDNWLPEIERRFREAGG